MESSDLRASTSCSGISSRSWSTVEDPSWLIMKVQGDEMVFQFWMTEDMAFLMEKG